MRRTLNRPLCLLLILLPCTGWAAGGRVEAMQMPAWLEQDGQRQALRPGMDINPRDKIVTGPGARMLIRLDEGSTVKLGENAQLDFARLQPAQQTDGVFKAAVNVLRGAFRFTTTALGKSRRREVDVRIGVLTAGIRGTDIWGSTQAQKDILCLIEGHISVQRDNEPEFSMQDPLSFYIVPKNEPALPVQPVPQAQLARWAAETELADGTGVLSVDGRWSVNLMSLAHDTATHGVLRALDEAGYGAQTQQARVNGRDWYRIRVEGFRSLTDARAFAAAIDGRFGVRRPWISRP